VTRIIWSFFKNQLILPHLDVDLKHDRFGIEGCDASEGKTRSPRRTRSKSTASASKASLPDQGMTEFNLERMYRSPNGTLRNSVERRGKTLH